MKLAMAMFKTIYLIPLILTIVLGCLESTMDEKEARKVLHDFYNNKEPEAISDYDLVKAGKPIVPYLIVEIQKKDMPRRRYAIGALGKIGDKRALPLLIKILEDRSELIHFRADALESIWHIDRQLGEEYARRYQGESKEIKRTIELLQKGII